MGSDTAANTIGIVRVSRWNAAVAGVDNSGGRACLAFTLLAARSVKRVVDAVERAVVAPQVEIIVHRAPRRQVLGKRTPLATRELCGRLGDEVDQAAW